GGGLVTGRLGALINRIFFLLHRRSRHVPMSVSGIVALNATIAFWVLTLWLGWWLLYVSDEKSVFETSTNRPASAVEKICFTGYTIFTLGIGDFRPGRDVVWQIATPLMSLTGLFLVTLSITYIIPVVQAVVHKRQLAVYLYYMG